MPSPLAHLSAGYALYRYQQKNLPYDRRRLLVLPLQMSFVAALSMMPDLDILLALAFNDMQKYHNNFSHSLLMGIPVAFASAGFFCWIYRTKFWLWFSIGLVSYHIHVIMDFFTAERGVMLFWPFTEARFASPVKLFYGLQWGLGWFSIWHLWTLFTESLFAIVVISAVIFLERRNSQRSNSTPRHLEQKENFE